MKKTTMWFAIAAVPLAVIYWLWFALVYSFVLTVRKLALTYRNLGAVSDIDRQHRSSHWDRPVFTGPSHTNLHETYTKMHEKKRHRRGHRGGKKHHKPRH